MIIDQLPEISTVQDTDEIPIERGTTTYKSPLSKIWARLTAAFGSNVLPNMDGTSAIGSSDKYARADHVHPHDNLIVRPNLLDNAYFVGGGSQADYGKFPINQRGQTSYNAAGYGIDRWKLDGYVALGLHPGYIEISKSSSDAYRGVSQRISISGMSGKTLTLSVLFSGSTTGQCRFSVIDSSNQLVSEVYPPVETTNTIMLGSMTFTSNDDILYIALRPYQIDLLRVIAVKLELGDTQTLAHQENGAWVLNEIPSYSAELDKCQHYLYPVLADNRSNGAFVGGYAFSNTSIRVSLPGPRLARSGPSIVFLSGSASSLKLVSDSGTLTPTAISAASFSRGSAVLLIFTVSGATTSKTYWLNSKDADFLISAEP